MRLKQNIGALNLSEIKCKLICTMSGGDQLKCRMLKKTFVVGVDEPLDLVKLTLSKQTGKQGWKNIFLVLIVLAKEN